ncbi:peptidylprolyl isomerase [Candidatus Peribacteria bacterium]|nr:peptidylprolyl isomerase [Candidatus Peribacteria bacterium]
MRRFLPLALVAVLLIGGALLLGTSSGKNLTANLFRSAEKNVTTATLHTTAGDITLQIYDTTVSTIAENFLKLAEAGMYDGVIFHRVIPGFMVQTGDFEHGNGTGGHAFGGGEIPDEINPSYSHTRGTVSMANRGPNTNGSQFFIMHADAPQLDGAYAIFGQVTDGMPIVDSIATAETGFMDRPLEPVTIETVTVHRATP